MERNETVPERRSVKTLLLCRVNADNGEAASVYKSVYKDVYTGPWNDGAHYISIGNVDSFSIYSTLPEKSANSPGWFQKLYEDRLAIIQQTKSDRSYHPIHLVANREYPRGGVKGSSFCIVTLLYGINAVKTDSNNLSPFEKAIEDTLNTIKSALQDEEEIKNFPEYEIFNAVNICDAVIIWYTNNIISTLKYASIFANDGYVRKTFTLVGFEMNDSGEVSEAALNRLENAPPTELFSARIQGSIRDPQTFSIFSDEISTISKPSGQFDEHRVFGQSDFEISLSKWNGKQFSDLIKYFMCNSKRMVDACWEIHTELMYEPVDGGKTATKPNSILDKSLLAYQKIITPEKISNYSWLSPFYELLCIHGNIDRHPVLHGPSYLFYPYIRITGEVLSRDNEIEKQMLIRSEGTIQEAVRAWSVLTDQLLRIDDFTFHGFGNGTVLYSTLPECALDFYHSFLMRIVRFLIEVEKESGRTANDDYDYGFMLLPELNQGVSIVPIFDVNDNPERQVGALRKLWPRKQVYIVYYPIEAVFSPIDFFAKLIHELFHHLGDSFRLREQRKGFLCRFLASEMVTRLGNWDDGDSSIERAITGRGIYNVIYDCLWECVSNNANESEPNENELREYLDKGFCELNSEIVEKQIETVLTMQIASDFVHNSQSWSLTERSGTKLIESIYRVIDEAEGDGLQLFYSEDGLRLLAFYSGLNYKQLREAWEKSKRNRDVDFSTDNLNLLDAMDYGLNLFKECYADIMMILTLKLTPKQYMNFLADNLQQENTVYITSTKEEDRLDAALEIAIISQRIALVLSACNAAVSFEEKFIIANLIYNSLSDPSQCIDFNDQLLNFVYPNCPSLSDEIVPYIYSVNSLVEVKGYLREVVASFHRFFSKTDQTVIGLETDLRSIQDDFKTIFCEGDFLSRRFFEVISAYHQAIHNNA